MHTRGSLQIYYTIVLNGWVHFVMYFYYFITGLGFTVPKVCCVSVYACLGMCVRVYALPRLACGAARAAVLIFMGRNSCTCVLILGAFLLQIICGTLTLCILAH